MDSRKTTRKADKKCYTIIIVAALHAADLGHTIDDLPEVFTKWRVQVEGRSTPVRACMPAPAAGSLPLPTADSSSSSSSSSSRIAEAFAAGCGPLPTLQSLGFADSETGECSERAALPFRGGETQALARLQHYLFGSDALATYFGTRNGMLGADYSTKLSPWLAAGCVSPRRVHAEAARYEAERVKNKVCCRYDSSCELIVVLCCCAVC
jgi:deoxyribodipyrimidine photo-lyase